MSVLCQGVRLKLPPLDFLLLSFIPLCLHDSSVLTDILNWLLLFAYLYIW